MDKHKHVIFLGAGASKGSGYPLANELRLRMSSPGWINKLHDHKGLGGVSIQPLVEYLTQHARILAFFRTGAFASLDEFCKLASATGEEGAFKNEIHNLRFVVRAVLGALNPELHFEDSEYYAFVQSLFEENLVHLRDDLAVLTYNYDPYIEYLLWRAYEKRGEIAFTARDTSVLNAVTSGLYSPEKTDWLEADQIQSRFCLLKLHGSVCRPGTHIAQEFELFFNSDSGARMMKLIASCEESVIPPVFFPWEVVANGGPADDSRFPIPDPKVRNLARGIWERARREVQRAAKISFVGLSMNPLLLEGLDYLFKGNGHKVEIVIANTDNKQFHTAAKDADWAAEPQSPAHVLNELLQRIAPNLKKYGKVNAAGDLKSDTFTLVADFGTFIREEMSPFNFGATFGRLIGSELGRAVR